MKATSCGGYLQMSRLLFRTELKKNKFKLTAELRSGQLFYILKSLVKQKVAWLFE